MESLKYKNRKVSKEKLKIKMKETRRSQLFQPIFLEIGFLRERWDFFPDINNQGYGLYY